MFLLMVKINSKDTYNLCYKYLDEIEAREQYNRLLETYPPSKIAFIETTDTVLGVTYNKDTLTPTVGSVTIPIATDTSPGAVQLATILQADFDNPIDYVDGVPVSVPPSLIKAMIEAGAIAVSVPDATTETSGKVRLANSTEADYTTASDGSDFIAVMQPLETKNMIEYAAQYETEYSPNVTNIKEALDNIYEQINYIPLDIISFTTLNTMFEIGATVSLSFNWTYSKDIIAQSLDDIDLPASNRAYTLEQVNATKNIVLTATDGEETKSKSIKVTFTKRIYWGVGTIPAEFNSQWIKALSNNVLTENYQGSYSFNATTNNYAFIAIPESYVAPNHCYINSWLTDLYYCGTLRFTSDYGIISNYKILRTTYSGLGSFTMNFV